MVRCHDNLKEVCRLQLLEILRRPVLQFTYRVSRIIWDKVNKVRVIRCPLTFPVVRNYLSSNQRRLADEPPVRYASWLVIGHREFIVHWNQRRGIRGKRSKSLIQGAPTTKGPRCQPPPRNHKTIRIALAVTEGKLGKRAPSTSTRCKAGL